MAWHSSIAVFSPFMYCCFKLAMWRSVLLAAAFRRAGMFPMFAMEIYINKNKCSLYIKKSLQCTCILLLYYLCLELGFMVLQHFNKFKNIWMRRCKFVVQFVVVALQIVVCSRTIVVKMVPRSWITHPMILKVSAMKKYKKKTR